MASTAASRTCAHRALAETRIFRLSGRSHRQSLLPLPPRSLPPHFGSKYETAKNSAPAQSHAAPSDADASPYFDALVRCFLLGVISGGLFESYTALCTLWNMSAQNANVWTLAKAAHAPQFVVDHVIGVCVLSIMYASECFGLASLSSRSSISSFMAALPKALIPVKFTALKSQLVKIPADLETTKSAAAAAATLEAPTKTRGRDKLSPRSAPASPSGGTASVDESPFVADKSRRPGLLPGQWNPALGGTAQAEAAKQSYLEGMYYCIGTVPRKGLQTDKIYSAYVMGTRVAYWKDADGKVNTISSTCTHRGAQLANGWIDTINGQTCVRCPYHAWAFSGDGTVKDIPVQPEGGYPKRPLQQSFETSIEDGKMWLFWGRPQIPKEERPPVPGTRTSSLDGMMSTTVSNSLEAPHHCTMEVLASEKSLAISARTLLGVMNCTIEASKRVEETWASRTVTYTLTPTKTRLSPLLPQGLSEAITVTISAQLPSSVVTTFQLRQGRCLRLEAHVMPEKYDTSRLTISAHHNFAAWAATGPFVRDMLTTVSDKMRRRAEKKPVKHLQEIRPFHVEKNSEKLMSAFTQMRVEFDLLGFGVSAEIAAAPQRVDM